MFFFNIKKITSFFFKLSISYYISFKVFDTRAANKSICRGHTVVVRCRRNSSKTSNKKEKRIKSKRIKIRIKLMNYKTKMFKKNFIFYKGYEDFLRHRADKEVNNKKIRILRDGKFKEHFWKDIRVCDYILLWR